jgi:CRP-like cAMP-binding protein
VLIDAPTLGVREHLLLLRSLPAFATVEDGALMLLAEHARVRRVRAGARLLSVDRPIDRVFLVLEGRLRWSRRGGEENFADRHQVVGWIALMAREEGLDARAETDSIVLELPSETLEHALEDHFTITRNMLRLGAAALVGQRGQLPVPPDRAPPAALGDKRESAHTLVERVMGMRGAPIFRRASVDAVLALARNWQELRAKPGDVMWRVGDESVYWLLIDYGKIECTSAEGRAVDVGAGFVLGIMDAIAQLPRSYEARAKTEIVGSRIDLEGFIGVLETHFDLARDFIAYLAKSALDRE